ncbi:MAG: DNA-protecting protein DprA [Faecalibacterium sp.]|nr:DNA-protecting protein DprA [Ruminococcus sp.]MCM1391509.1 DNA-protecting protein DprA [Ruminococcus sp.]MCM1485873.1 DNA-protecting protein DprA [Faecalibacterium sp.]
MKVAIVGSRDYYTDNIGDYLPEGTDEIVSGGARGIDSCARIYAVRHNLKLTEFLPDYNTYGKRAPLIRNLEIIDYADEVIAFWNGESRGTKFVIDNCCKKNKKVRVVDV